MPLRNIAFFGNALAANLYPLSSIALTVVNLVLPDYSVVQVLHVHGFSGAGLQCAYLLTSCYLLYVRDFDLYDKAYDALPSASHQLISGPNRQAMQRYNSSHLCSCMLHSLNAW